MKRRRADEAGQVLVIVAVGLIGLIAMVGLVIDGGYAWGRQRITQNGADAAAKAGTVVILEWLDGEAKDADDVGCAVALAAAEGNVMVDDMQFTDHEGNLLDISVPECNAGGAMPLRAQGVKAVTSQEFDTFLMSVVGISQLTARSDATAIVGPISATGISLPVTFPQTMDLCDDSGDTYTIREWDVTDPYGNGTDGNWEPYEVLPSALDDPVNSVPDIDNLSIIPLCTTAPGSVGWLDFGCGNLADQINDPCDVFVPIPGWVDTHTGNINCCELELSGYHGDIPGEYEPERRADGTVDTDHDVEVKLPIHATTCDAAPVPPTTGSPAVLAPCPDGEWTGEGDNIAYGVPWWVAFILDEAYVQGGDTECEDGPGMPELDSPGGGVGCLKGWFVKRIGPPDAVSIGDVNPGDPVDLGVTLIR